MFEIAIKSNFYTYMDLKSFQCIRGKSCETFKCKVCFAILLVEIQNSSPWKWYNSGILIKNIKIQIFLLAVLIV